MLEPDQWDAVVTLMDMRKVEAAAGPLGLTVVTVEIRRMEDTAPGSPKPRATKGPRHRLKESVWV